jgi:hypothetical protein
MRRIAGLSKKQPLKQPAAKVRKAPPKKANARRKPARAKPAPQLYANNLLAQLFKGYAPEDLKVWGDRYPAHMRANLQPVIDELFIATADQHVGAVLRYRTDTLSMTELMSNNPEDRVAVGPLSYVAIDTGEDEPARCVKNVLILKRAPMPHAIFISTGNDPTEDRYVDVDIAIPREHPGSEAFAAKILAPLEDAIQQCRAYRGKVLSLEKQNSYSGRVGAIHVHHLPRIDPDQVILPAPTKQLLDRCVIDFMKSRAGLRAMGFQTKRGVLLYGPPGTGKTHTIRYLAGNLPGTTTLLITAEQVGLLPHYMSLARLLQPAMVVIEDVDLIARSREQMRSSCDETMLNALLNEMDGLKENTDILFVLTTNRPHDLEAALANRPGRIDQAIEVPVPDAPSRDKLLRLYARGLKLTDKLMAEAVKRTEGVSAAFIKELMRRIAQAVVSRGEGAKVGKEAEPKEADLTEALDAMLFSGGALNVKLLGGSCDLV